MKRLNRFLLATIGGAALSTLLASPAFAVVSSGAGGSGVTVGQSSLFPVLDYSDTFTQTDQGGAPNRPSTPAVQPPPAYIIENSYTNLPGSFNIGAGFSFASDTAGLVNGSPPYPGTSGAGSATGITQTGGSVDYAIPYNSIRNQYIVQFDAVQSSDRIDISSGAGPGIFAPNSLSVFFRGDGSGNASLFNGVTDTPIQASIPTFNTGIPGGNGQWHNYAVRYDQPNMQIEIYVDEVSKGIIDLTTFAGGLYQNWSANFVGGGGGVGGGQNRTWTDNFQVGGVGPVTNPINNHPNPGPLPGLPSGLVSYWDFNEADGPAPGFTLNFAYDRQDGNHGTFQGITDRTAGLVGLGAANLHGTGGEGINVGAGTGNNFATPNGLTVETLFVAPNWDGNTLAEFFRKEDGGNRVLLSFQPDVHINNAFGQLVGSDNGFGGISFGINTGGYKEMDVALDGLDGRPSLAQIQDGVHHLVATYDAATGVKAMYIDGALVAMIDGPDNVPIVNGGGAGAFIGSTNGGEPFSGVLDEVAYYSRALTPEEIQVHYQNFQAGQNYFIPEPGTWVLAAIGIAITARMARNRRRRLAS